MEDRSLFLSILSRRVFQDDQTENDKRNAQCQFIFFPLSRDTMLNETQESNSTAIVVPMVLPFVVQCLFLFLFALVILLATIGNLTVIWIVLAHRRMRTPTNYFLVNLAYADVLNAVVNIPFNSYYMITQVTWPFGSLACSCVQSVSHISIAANVLTYVAISLDRSVERKETLEFVRLAFFFFLLFEDILPLFIHYEQN